jgi:hypothetical protein
MKRLVIVNAAALVVSSIVNWLFVSWVRKALLSSAQALLPLPALTNIVLRSQLALMAPLLIFVLILLVLTSAPNRGDWATALLTASTLSMIILMSAVVSVACLLPWLPRVP